MRTTGQVTGSIGAGAAAGAIIVWILGRTIGLSADETNILGPSIAAILSAAASYLSPYLPRPSSEQPPTIEYPP